MNRSQPIELELPTVASVNNGAAVDLSCFDADQLWAKINANNAANTVVVQTSPDGTNWADLATVTGTTIAVVLLYTARFIRVQTTAWAAGTPHVSIYPRVPNA